MKCKKCGSDDWYVRGTYKRCTPCHNEAQITSYHNRKLGNTRQRKHSFQARPLSESLRITSGKKLASTCNKGHEFTEDNTRLEVDRKGIVHRRCLRCQYLRMVRRYGNEVPAQVPKLLGQDPWQGLE